MFHRTVKIGQKKAVARIAFNQSQLHFLLQLPAEAEVTRYIATIAIQVCCSTDLGLKSLHENPSVWLLGIRKKETRFVSDSCTQSSGRLLFGTLG